MNRLLLLLILVILITSISLGIYCLIKNNEYFSQKENINAFISTSPRPLDNNECIKSIENIIYKIHEILPTANIIVSCDGINKSKISKKEIENYIKKIDYIKSLKNKKIFKHKLFVDVYDEWLHQAEILRRSMKKFPSQYIFSTQDDLDIMISKTEANNLINYLKIYDDIDYIKLNANHEVDLNKHYEQKPWTKHKKINDLKLTYSWSDRPHFATKYHYDNIVWKLCKSNIKRTMEEQLNKLSQKSKKWKLWIYAPDFNLQNEKHNKCGAISTRTIRI